MADIQAVAIMREFADEHDLPFGLVLAVAYLESGWAVQARGDSGLACGLIQVRTDVHGRDCAWWSGHDGARRSFALMAPRWRSAWERGGDGWTDASDEERAVYVRGYQQAAQGSQAASMDRCREAVTMALRIEAQEQPSMVVKPPILQFPAAAGNINVRPAGVLYECLVVHTTQGGSDIPTLGRWFGGENIRQGMNGSTHFGAAPDGTLGQFVGLAQQPIAHGQEAGATAKLARDNQGLSANAWAIGCETLDGGVPGTCTLMQLESIARLFAWLWQSEIAPHAATTGAALDRDHIIGHYELAPASRARCPSWPESRFQALIARVGALLAAPVPDPRDAQIVNLKAALAITAGAIDAEALAAENSARRLRGASQGARDALMKWG